MDGLPNQNHAVSAVFEDQEIHEECAAPDQEGHGLQGEGTDLSSDGGGEDSYGGSGTWDHHLTRDQGRRSQS